MKPLTKRTIGLTLIDVLIVIAVIGILAALLLPTLLRARTRALRITCTNYLKQIGLGARVWDGDHKGLYPMQVFGTNGGTAAFVSGTNAFRHFQAMSNELSTPYVLICPAESDRLRSRAANFDLLNNSNLSYFVGVDANETNPQLILSGDRNITNGMLLNNGILGLTTNNLSGWTSDLHDGVGNIALADGSVQQVSTRGLREMIANSGLATNRLQMPTLKP